MRDVEDLGGRGVGEGISSPVNHGDDGRNQHAGRRSSSTIGSESEAQITGIPYSTTLLDSQCFADCSRRISWLKSSSSTLCCYSCRRRLACSGTRTHCFRAAWLRWALRCSNEQAQARYGSRARDRYRTFKGQGCGETQTEHLQGAQGEENLRRRSEGSANP